MKIGTSNPAIGQPLDGRVGCAHQLLAGTARPTTLLSRETVGTAHPTADIINFSIPPHVSGEKLSSLLSDLIKILNQFENPPESARPGIDPFVKGEFVESLFYKGEDPLTFLKAFIENSGLLYEAKIAKGDIHGTEDDLKGILLRLIEKKGDQSETSKTARVLFNDIEARQLLNVKGKEEGVFYLQIPVSLPQGASTAEIYIRRDGKGTDDHKGDAYGVGFSIELREAGFVSIDAFVRRNNVSIRIKAESSEFLEFMKNFLPELSERLAGRGMILTSM